MITNKGSTFKQIQDLVYNEYCKNGYLDMWQDEQALKGLVTKRQFINDIAELGLITTEISEAIECIRKSYDKQLLSEECADIIIRTLNFCSRKNIDVEKEIIYKHSTNMNRIKLHGKVV